MTRSAAATGRGINPRTANRHAAVNFAHGLMASSVYRAKVYSASPPRASVRSDGWRCALRLAAFGIDQRWLAVSISKDCGLRETNRRRARTPIQSLPNRDAPLL